MSAARLVRNVLIGVSAVAGVFAAVVGAWWLSVAEPWYDRDVVQQLRSGARTSNTPWPDLTPQVAALFPRGMNGDTARSTLRSNGFSCASAPAVSGSDVRLTCTRKPHDLFCAATFTVGLVIDEGGRVTGQSGNSYTVCL